MCKAYKANLTKYYIKSSEKIESNKDAFPKKLEINEKGNIKIDGPRIKHILYLLNFVKLFVNKKSKFRFKEIVKDEEQVKFNESVRIREFRELLVRISTQVMQLSDTLRYEYKNCLQPTPFEWEVFERFGSFMICQQDVKAIPVPGKYISSNEIELFFLEIQSTELIVEGVVDFFIESELDTLIEIFTSISKKEKIDKFSPLYAIHSITRRLVDCQILDELLFLTCAGGSKEIKDAKTSLTVYDFKDKSIIKQEVSSEVRHIDINTKLGIHAQLRRLQRIGELLTGKYFSSDLKALLPENLLQPFIDIRDLLSHQEEKSAYKKLVNNFVVNKELFQSVLNELVELNDYLYQLVIYAQKRLPKYPVDNDYKDFLNELVSANKKRVHEEVEKSKRMSQQPFSRNNNLLVDEYESTAVLDYISNRVSDDKKHEILKKWKDLLCGNATNKVFKLMADKLPSSIHQNNKQWKRIEKICKKAMRSGARARDGVKKKAPEENSDHFKNARDLAQQYNAIPRTKKSLLLSEKLSGAVGCLENIKEFLTNDLFIRANFSYQSLADFSKEFRKLTVPINRSKYQEYLTRIVSSDDLWPAIEYNLVMLLHYYKNFKNQPAYVKLPSYKKNWLTQNESMLVSLGNYLSHGNMMLDARSYQPDPNKRSFLSPREQQIAPLVFTLIFKMLPALEQAQSELQKELQKNPPAHTDTPTTTNFSQSVYTSPLNNKLPKSNANVKPITKAEPEDKFIEKTS